LRGGIGVGHVSGNGLAVVWPGCFVSSSVAGSASSMTGSGTAILASCCVIAVGGACEHMSIRCCAVHQPIGARQTYARYEAHT